MIRIQMICHGCKQYVDATVAAKRGRLIAATFEDAHLYHECMEEEEERGGQDEAGTGAGEDPGPATDITSPAPQGPSRPH